MTTIFSAFELNALLEAHTSYAISKLGQASESELMGMLGEALESADASQSAQSSNFTGLFDHRILLSDSTEVTATARRNNRAERFWDRYKDEVKKAICCNSVTRNLLDKDGKEKETAVKNTILTVMSLVGVSLSGIWVLVATIVVLIALIPGVNAFCDGVTCG